jgi:ribose 5-phosphate isomerase RpiB
MKISIGARIVGPWLAADLVQGHLAATFSADQDCRRRVATPMAVQRSYNTAAAE